jgi:hypothetical protein
MVNHSCLRVGRQRHHAVLDTAIRKLHVPPNTHLKSFLTHQVVTLRQFSVVERAVPATVHLVEMPVVAFDESQEVEADTLVRLRRRERWAFEGWLR